VQNLIGIAIEGMAVPIPVNANPEHPLTKEQVPRILDGLNALPPRAPMADALELERYSALSCVQDILRDPFFLIDIFASVDIIACNYSADRQAKLTRYCGSSIEASVFRLGLTAMKNCNGNAVYRRMNEAYDALQEPSPRAKFAAIEESARQTLFSPYGFGWRFLGLTPDGRGKILADTLIQLLCPAVNACDGAVQRLECVENMQRLTLAILLYQQEHGKLPDENWGEQIKPYLGKDAERYFSCPLKPSPQGETMYAMIQHGDTTPDSLDTAILLELKASVPLDKAVISVEEALQECQRLQQQFHHHPGGTHAGYRSGAVRFVPDYNIDEAELLRQLGRE
jgi:hypothetical protein